MGEFGECWDVGYRGLKTVLMLWLRQLGRWWYHETPYGKTG